MKNLSRLLLLILWTTNHVIAQQFPTDAAYSSITANTPSLPNLYSSLTDNTVPTPIAIKRITQYQNGWYPTHEYAKTQPWNADATIYKFYSKGIYDADTHQEIGNLPGGDLYPTYWSNTDADKLWGFKGEGDIKSYKVSTNTVSLHDHLYFNSNTNVEYDTIQLGPGEGNIDKNDHYVAFVGKKGTDMYVIIYNLQTFAVQHREKFSGAWGNETSAPQYVDWVSVSQSGDYVGIMWNHNTTSAQNPFSINGTGHYGVEIYQTDNMSYLRRIADYGNHGDFGFAQNNKEVFVQFWGPPGTLNMYYLDGSGRVVLSNHADFNSEGHVSCRALNRPGWAYVSQDYADHSGQIVVFKLDDDTNTEIVEHFGHHFSTSASYLKSPMPVPTPNGDKVMFKSDFGNTTAAVIYTFEATVAAPLAVEWLRPMTATKRDKDVLLQWTVAQQVNNDKFVIEHSTDARHFEAIQTIKGDGNRVLPKEFRAIHPNPAIGDNYYRIKQIDLDGQFEYSNIAYVEFRPKDMAIYPNPAHQAIYLSSKKDLLRQVAIYNTTGQLVRSLSQKSATINIADLPNGFYWVKIIENGQTYRDRFLKE
ncbi:MAG TPA: T9SS type A sorting domain-containing protein [Saprospiraceae bacterium]|nr:T9SS type A sorting domain-containing protein [Saprospiraceae bacterium]